MKPTFAVAVAAGAAALALPASAQEVEIRDAVARVVVIPEARTDIAVEIIPGRGVPDPVVTRNGRDVVIDGRLHERANRQSWNCRGGRGYFNPTEAAPNDAVIRVRGRDPIRLSDAPLITIRTPITVNVKAGGAVWGAIGRAEAVELENLGCGSWTVGNVAGPLDIDFKGSGDMRAGTSQALDISLAGSGDVQTAATGDADLGIAGSGTIRVASVRNLDADVAGSGEIRIGRIEGAAEASIPGSGSIVIDSGRASRLDASIMGSGDIVMRGTAGDVDARIMGSGDVTVGQVTGAINQRHMGSGRVRVGG